MPKNVFPPLKQPLLVSFAPFRTLKTAALLLNFNKTLEEVIKQRKVETFPSAAMFAYGFQSRAKCNSLGTRVGIHQSDKSLLCSCLVDFMSALPAQTATESNKEPRTVTSGSVLYAVNMKGSKHHVHTDCSTKCKRLHYYLGNFHLEEDLQMKTQRTIDNKYTFVSAILFLPEFKLQSQISWSHPLPASKHKLVMWLKQNLGLSGGHVAMLK